MIEFIKSMDMMGREFKFNIEGGAYRTIPGGLLTMFTSICFLVLAWYYGQDMYQRKQPAVLIKQSMLKLFPRVQVNSSVFNFGYRIENTNGELVNDPRIFTYELMYTSYSADENGVWHTDKKLIKELQSCGLNHFDNKTLHHHKLQNYKCIENNYTFGGDWGGDFIDLPQFLIRRCNNKTEKEYNIKCLSDAEVKAKHSNFYVDTYLQKNLVNPSSYKSAIQHTYVYNYKDINIYSGEAVKQRIYYSTGRLKTDTGFIFEDLSHKEFLEYEHSESGVSAWEPSRGPYVSMVQFYISRNHREYERVYDKISDTLANVGGLMSLFLYFIDFIYSYYIESSYNVYLQEKLVSMNRNLNQSKRDPNGMSVSVEPNNLEMSMDISKVILDNTNNQQSQNPSPDVFIHESLASPKNNNNKKKKHTLYKIKCLNEDNNKDMIQNKELEKVIESKKTGIEEIKVTCCERLYFVYCCFNKNKQGVNIELKMKYELLKACEQEVDRKIEILELIKIADQLKIIKKLLLNENQCFMLQNRGITNLIDTRVSSELDENQQIEEKERAKKKNLIEYLLKQQRDHKLNQIDTLLFQYLEKDLKEEIKGEVKFDI